MLFTSKKYNQIPYNRNPVNVMLASLTARSNMVVTAVVNNKLIGASYIDTTTHSLEVNFGPSNDD